VTRIISPFEIKSVFAFNQFDDVVEEEDHLDKEAEEEEEQGG